MSESDLQRKFIEQFIIFTDAYFGAKNNSEPAILSCLELMRFKFSHLSLTEINEAARQYSAGRLGITIVPYNGIFTASMFGDLLTAYCKRRDKIKAALVESEQAIEREKQEMEESKLKEQAFKIEAQNWLYENKGKNNYKRWIDLPYGICLALTDMENIDIELRNECFQIAKTEIENDKLRQLDKGNLDSYRQLNNIIEGLEAGTKTAKQELISRAKSIYPRLNVWKLINGK